MKPIFIVRFLYAVLRRSGNWLWLVYFDAARHKASSSLMVSAPNWNLEVRESSILTWNSFFFLCLLVLEFSFFQIKVLRFVMQDRIKETFSCLLNLWTTYNEAYIYCTVLVCCSKEEWELAMTGVFRPCPL